VIRCGIAGWTDRQLSASRTFYPPRVRTSEERLSFYATQFPLVEVDSTYYGIPPRKNAEVWAARTPAGFLFDVKSFALFTQHPTNPMGLPADVRAALPPALAERRTLYLEQLPAEVVDAAWDAFRDAIQPLRDAGRLGAVAFQLPPWVYPSTKAMAHIEECRERMDGFPIAVEFRRRDWLDEHNGAGTLAFLRSLDIPLVSVDVPQGFTSSVPPVWETTSDQLAVVRFLGRNHGDWERRGAPPSVRHRHDYEEAELCEWVPRILAMEAGVREVHAIMATSPSHRAAADARRLEALLSEAGGGAAPGCRDQSAGDDLWTWR
jgi:uncharacterized protein YecE (DUF72 family)